MSVIVRPTKTLNMAFIPSETLPNVKSELERQNIKFVSKYVGTQLMKKLGVDKFIDLHESSYFISEYNVCLIEAYGNAKDLHELGMSFYVPREKYETKEPTPLDEAYEALDMFYEMADWLEDSIENGCSQEQIADEADMLLDSEEELNEKIDAAIDWCNNCADTWSVRVLQERKDKVNAYLQDLWDISD